MRDARFEKRCNFVWSKRLHFTIEIKAFLPLSETKTLAITGFEANVCRDGKMPLFAVF